MLQEIRRRSFRRTLPGVIFFLVVAVALVYFSGLIAYLTPAIPVSQADLSSGKSFHVKDEVTYLYAVYAKETTTRRGSPSTTSGYGYITLTPNTDQFIGLWTKGSTMRTMERRWDDQDPYFEGTQEGNPDPLPVEGILTPLTGEDLKFYNDQVAAIVSGENNRVTDGDFARYVIDTNAFSATWWMAGLAGLSLLIAIVLLIKSRTTVVNTLQKAIQAADDPTQAETSLEALYHSGQEPLRGFRMNEEWFLYMTGLSAQVIPTKDIQWAYRKEIVTRHGLFMKSKSYQVVVADQQKRHAIPLQKKQTDTMLETISRFAPHAVMGYDAALEKIYKQDPANFIANAQAWSASNHPESEQA